MYEEIINGLLLSDGYLVDSKPNSSFEISQEITHKDLVIKVSEILDEMNFGYSMKSKPRKDGIDYRLSSHRNEFWTLLRAKWYKGKQKIIPDIELTPLTLAYLFMGDGSSSWTENGLVKVDLSTQSFTFSDNQLLKTKLEKLDLEFHITKHRWKNHLYYYLKTKKSINVINFMKLVDPYILPSFSYKIKVPRLTSYSISAKRKWKYGLYDSKGQGK